jgi:hypothetical protein
MFKSIKHAIMWLFSMLSTGLNAGDLAADQLLISAAEARNDALKEAGISLDDLTALKLRKPFVG